MDPRRRAPTARKARSLVAKFDFVEQRIRDLGEKIKPSSRLDRERRLFFGADGTPRTVEPNEDCFLDALEAQRDYTLFEFILERWPFRARDPLPAGKLKAALKDAVDPHAARSTSPGRDTQVELLVAVAVHGGGAAVCFEAARESRWPDLRARIVGRHFYVEAKRVKTQGALLEAVEHGVSQIAPTTCPGALFVDVSMAFNRERGFVHRAMDDAEFMRLHLRALNLGIQPFERDLHHLLAGSRVAGIVFQDHQLRQHPSHGWMLETCAVTFPNPQASLVDARAWTHFARTLDFGWSS